MSTRHAIQIRRMHAMSAHGEPEAEEYRVLKARVAYNPVVFGLPNLKIE